MLENRLDDKLRPEMIEEEDGDGDRDSVEDDEFIRSEEGTKKGCQSETVIIMPRTYERTRPYGLPIRHLSGTRKAKVTELIQHRDLNRESE